MVVTEVLVPSGLILETATFETDLEALAAVEREEMMGSRFFLEEETRKGFLNLGSVLEETDGSDLEEIEEISGLVDGRFLENREDNCLADSLKYGGVDWSLRL